MTCPRCHSRNTPDAGFCLRCGHVLTPRRVAPPSPPAVRRYTKWLLASASAVFLLSAGILYITLRLDSEGQDAEAWNPAPAVTAPSAGNDDPGAPTSSDPGVTASPAGNDDPGAPASPEPGDGPAVPAGSGPPGFAAFAESSKAHLDERAEMAFDGDLTSGWRGENGAGDWIECRARGDIPQTVTGVTLYGLENISELEFSAGDWSERVTVADGDTQRVTFARPCAASALRVTVRQGGDAPFIAEIECH
jgi:hypothetical protein